MAALYGGSTGPLITHTGAHCGEVCNKYLLFPLSFAFRPSVSPNPQPLRWALGPLACSRPLAGGPTPCPSPTARPIFPPPSVTFGDAGQGSPAYCPALSICPWEPDQTIRKWTQWVSGKSQPTAKRKAFCRRGHGGKMGAIGGGER